MTGLYVITDAERSRGRSHQEIVRAAVRGGAAIVQLREKHLERTALRELARELLDICREGGATFIVNDDPGLAADVGADGVHVGPDDPPPAEARRIVGPDAIVGWSAKGSLELARQAASLGVSYVAAGSIFPTGTKEGAAVVGLELLRQMRQVTSLPIAAIGGISLGNVASVIQAGADMACAASAVVSAEDVEGTCRRFSELIEQARGARV